MGLPQISIEFFKRAIQSIAVGAGGVVGIILSDTANVGVLVLKDVTDVPSDFTAANKGYVERAFLGAPKKVVVYTMGSTTTYSYSEATPEAGSNPKSLGLYELVDGEYVATDDTSIEEGKQYYTRTANTVTTTLTDALKYFKNNPVNYMAGTPDISSTDATTISTWAKGLRANTKNRTVAVLPKTVGDSQSVINFTVVNSTATDCIHVGDINYSEAEYCSRIAGLLAGLALTVSSTYKPLAEVTAIPEITGDSEVDTAIDAGKLTLYNNGDGIVIARGVNSLTTITQDVTEDLKKIKIVAIQDLIETDIYSTINKSYIGNYNNSYDNKCLLITAIQGYLKKLDTGEGGAGYINEDHTVMIDTAAQKTYLEGIGVDTEGMSEQEIKEANTGSWVFLYATVGILDAIEDVRLRIKKN